MEMRGLRVRTPEGASEIQIAERNGKTWVMDMAMTRAEVQKIKERLIHSLPPAMSEREIVYMMAQIIEEFSQI